MHAEKRTPQETCFRILSIDLMRMNHALVLYQNTIMQHILSYFHYYYYFFFCLFCFVELIATSQEVKIQNFSLGMRLFSKG